MTSNGVNGLTHARYDSRNLPYTIEGTSMIYYAYDADGQRVSKKEGSTTTTYIRGADGQTIATYENGSIDKWNILSGGDVIGTVTSGGSKEYFLKDHLGSTRTVVNSSGTAVAYFDFYPFGKLMPGRFTTSNDDRYKFTSHELDEEAGLDLSYAGARYLDSEIGTWLSIDPLVDEYPGWSPYNYALNNPINFGDPTGMAPEVHFDYDRDGNEYLVVDKGDTIFDIIRFMDKHGISSLDFTDGNVVDENGQGIEGAKAATGRTIQVQSGFPGQGLPFWLDPLPTGKVKAASRLTKSGAAYYGLLSFIKGRSGKLTLNRLLHIMRNHGANGVYKWKGKFLQGTDLATLEKMIQKTIATGKKGPNTQGRAGNIYELDFGYNIGTKSGKNLTKLKVVVINKKVHTAYPIK